MATTVPESLKVFWGRRLVGELWSTAQAMQFRYADEWRQTGRPISISMPLSAQVYTKEAQNFFSNLLPEGDFRRKIERIYKVSEDNDFSLLARIGGDCAGALSVAYEPASDEEGWYQTLSEDALAKLIDTGGVSAYAAQNTSRLSLAGVQGKLPVHRDGKTLYLPMAGAPSSAILKFNRYDKEFPHLIENEFYLSRIAFHLGLPVIDCELLRIDDQRIFIAKRYDRELVDGWPVRLHQEDFCQALGYDYRHKYEKEGGPGLATIIQLARNQLDLTAVRRIIEWQLLNVVFGNSDGHAKNLSILYLDNQTQLAPFYDLVCTRAYPRLDRRLAVFIAEQDDPDRINPHCLEQFAKETGVTKRFLNQLIRSLIDRADQAVEAAREDLAKSQIDERNLQAVINITGKLKRSFAKRFDRL